MPTTKSVPKKEVKDTEPIKQEPKTAKELVEGVCPMHRDFDRRICELWTVGESTYFRVNYHDPNHPKVRNAIVLSNFVRVKNGVVVENNKEGTLNPN